MDGYRATVNRHDIDAVMVLQDAYTLSSKAAAEAGKAIYWAGEINDPQKMNKFGQPLRNPVLHLWRNSQNASSSNT